MKILILGGSGMLGHRLWINFQKYHETWVTVRGDGTELPANSAFQKQCVRTRVDAINFDQIIRAMASVQPELVVNCIGLIKQQGPMAKDPLSSISLNAMLPHRISLACKAANIRMIHISTDCVFTGNKGMYVESDESDAQDLYGRTKFLGEVAYNNCVTLRTSIIGRELKTNLGLIEWFLSQTGTIQGYKRAIYTGFTTDELSNIILNYVIPNDNLSGLFHVSSDPISKYDLLLLAKNYFRKNILILPNNEFNCDRSLDSTIFRQITKYGPPSWESMISELAQTSEFYEVLRQ